MQKITGNYLKTLSKNGDETTFVFRPDDMIKQAQKGTIVCRGTIGRTATRTPLVITGEFCGNTFLAEDITFPKDSEDDAYRLLSFVFPSLSVDERHSIIAETGNDILEFSSRPGASSAIARALEPSGNAANKARSIVSKLRVFKDGDEMYRELFGFGIPIQAVDRLRLSGITMEKIREDPYQIMYGLDLMDAERLAKEYLNITPYDQRRVKGFVDDAMSIHKSMGHTNVTFPAIYKTIQERIKYSLFPDDPISLSAIYRTVKGMGYFLSVEEVGDKAFIYEKRILGEESTVSYHIARILRSAGTLIPCPDTGRVEQHIGFKYNKAQEEAFGLLKTTGLKIITGPPGSGKTALIRGLINEYRTHYPHRRIALCATTGAASQVMSSACGEPARTLHKLLAIRPFKGYVISKAESSDPVEADLVIVDETSMMDLTMAACLFKAVKSGTLLVLVGDPDQLGSVGYGMVLEDLIRSEATDVYRLEEVMRQSGLICTNALKVRNGDQRLESDDSFLIHRFSCQEDALRFFLKQEIKQGSLVLSPVKKGLLGVRSLNHRLQPKQKEFCFIYGNNEYYVGDRVIMTSTDYHSGYYNGDLGRIIAYEDDMLYVDFHDKKLMLSHEDFVNLDLAFSMTIHKSQGSEAEEVHILLPDEKKHMLTRRLLYTGITRARKVVHIYAVGDALETAIANRSERKRRSNLAYRIKKEMDRGVLKD